MSEAVDIDLVVRIVLRVLAELGVQPRLASDTDRSPSDVHVHGTVGALGRWALISERDVLAAQASGELVLPAGAVVTPLARDTAAAKGVRLVEAVA